MKRCIVGFTMIELLIVMTFMAIMGTIGIGYYFNYQRQTTLRSTVEEINAFLYATQQKSIGQEESSQWGVHFVNPTGGDKPFYASFKGSSYVTPVETRYLDSALDFSYPADGASVDIIFNKMTGKVSDGLYKKIYVLLNPGTAVRAVNVSPLGVITINDGEVGWWGFDEGAGTTAGDSSGYGNVGTINGATWVSGANCKSGSCLSLDGVNDYVNAGGILDSVFNGTSSWTVSQWVNDTNGYSYYPQFCKGNPTNGPGFTIHGNNGRIQGGSGTSGYDVSAGIFQELLPGNGWKHTVVTYDGSVFRAYINGVAKGTFNWTYGIGDTSNFDIWFGRFWGPYGAMFMDDVRIYDHALSSEEVKHLYETTK